MNIAGLVKTSTIDYPEKIACVIFTAGCNYDCWYCHNRALLSNPPLLDEEKILSFLQRRTPVLEGVVISGGEPTQQNDLVSFVAKIKGIGYSVKLDTNGSNPAILNKLLQNSVVDYVAIDYKAPFEKYYAVCRHDAAGVQECIGLLQNSPIAWEMRTTVIPQLDNNDIVAMAKALPPLPLYALQRYRPINDEESQAVCRLAQLTALAHLAREYQPNTIARI